MPLPKRWLPYSKFGEQIPGTRFVAFKCPLRPALCQNLPADKQLTPSLLMDYLPKLKMIIDLTFTNKYYAPEEFRKAGLCHVKVACEGHVVPKKGVINKFFDTVDSFLVTDPEGLIGVHCTHGVNRTGFLICKYMISKLGFTPTDAVTAFKEARGHGIERLNYVHGLGVLQAQAETLVSHEPEDEIFNQSETSKKRRIDYLGRPVQSRFNNQQQEMRRKKPHNRDYHSGPASNQQLSWRQPQQSNYQNSHDSGNTDWQHFNHHGRPNYYSRHNQDPWQYGSDRSYRPRYDQYGYARNERYERGRPAATWVQLSRPASLNEGYSSGGCAQPSSTQQEGPSHSVLNGLYPPHTNNRTFHSSTFKRTNRDRW